MKAFVYLLSICTLFSACNHTPTGPSPVDPGPITYPALNVTYQRVNVMNPSKLSIPPSIGIQVVGIAARIRCEPVNRVDDMDFTCAVPQGMVPAYGYQANESHIINAGDTAVSDSIVYTGFTINGTKCTGGQFWLYPDGQVLC